MNTSFQFAPIRVYSGARSNKKCKAITEFLPQKHQIVIIKTAVI